MALELRREVWRINQSVEVCWVRPNIAETKIQKECFSSTCDSGMPVSDTEIWLWEFKGSGILLSPLKTQTKDQNGRSQMLISELSGNWALMSFYFIILGFWLSFLSRSKYAFSNSGIYIPDNKNCKHSLHLFFFKVSSKCLHFYIIGKTLVTWLCGTAKDAANCKICLFLCVLI